MNDSRTLSAYGSREDAYAVFARMLERGDLPDDWNALVAGASTRDARAKLAAICGDPTA